MKPFFAVVVLSASFAASPAYSQTFSSGSTGADGTLDLSTTCINNVSNDVNECYVQLPPSGVLNYTTINIPAPKILKFKKNLHNTPVYLLAQGAVTIAGSISGSGSASREPGPGGFAGGLGKLPDGLPGFGPGAGPQADGSLHGKWVGPLSLVPPIGGSGGAGGACVQYAFPGSAGTSGGGAVVIASSTNVTVTGSITADGGSIYYNACGAGGNGSGGAIRVIGNSVTVSGSLSARSGCIQFNGGSSCGASTGVIRLEAPTGALSFTGSATPAAILSTINPAIFASTPTSLSIVSVGGYSVPSYSGQRFDTVDLLLPMQLPDPINVVVTASNIPLGTSVGINFGTGNSGTVIPGTLSGSLASSTATVQVSGLNRTALAYLFVSATFAVSSGAASMNPPGPDQVALVRVTTAPGAPPQLTFQRADGSTVDAQRLPPDLLKYFRP